MERLSCDVLVIGAGPAGSTAARVAADAGAKVLLVDCKAEIGVPVQCAGYVSQAIRWHVDLTDKCVIQSIDGLRTFLPDGVVLEEQVPGYILNRAELDRQLVAGGVAAGARLLLRTRIAGRREDGILAQSRATRLLLLAKVVVGADGPGSTIARWMDLAPPRFARAIQYEVALRHRLSFAEVHFQPTFRGGYAWMFPSGNRGRVGAAFVGDARKGIDGLKEFLKDLEGSGQISRSELALTAGFVPVSGPRKLCEGNVLLVGDAAGHTHPITGAGIVNAVIAGEMAGRAASEAALSDDLGRIKEYAEEWRELFGSTMERACEKRQLLEENWDSSPSELSQTIRDVWIGSGE